MTTDFFQGSGVWKHWFGHGILPALTNNGHVDNRLTRKAMLTAPGFPTCHQFRGHATAAAGCTLDGLGHVVVQRLRDIGTGLVPKVSDIAIKHEKLHLTGYIKDFLVPRLDQLQQEGCLHSQTITVTFKKLTKEKLLYRMEVSTR
eukprot:scaffold6270_cov162-Amphora_coffeaeformis.AAC.7